MTPEQRSLRSRIANHSRWAKASSAEREANTAPARKAFADRWERQVDPDGVLPPDERARRAEHAKKAHFLSMAAKSAQSRARKRKAA